MTLILLALLIALAFEFINGFHDTANAIATSVSTKVLTPRQAISLAAASNLLGAMAGVSVATTIGKGLVDVAFVTPQTVFCALLGAVLWNLFTWWLGLPSSSSHALIGGLCGATLASARNDWSVVHWAVRNPASGKLEGLWPKVVAPMFTSPVLGIMVDHVRDVIDLPPGDLEPAPAFGNKLRPDFIRGVGRIGGRFVLILEMARVLAPGELAALDAEAS